MVFGMLQRRQALAAVWLSALVAAAVSAKPDWRETAFERQAKGDYGTNAPLIAVLTNPCEHKHCPSRAIVSGPVVDWLASAGARVVPLRYYDSREDKENLLRSVNGLLFPGGAADLHVHSQYTQGAREALDIVREINDQGNLFPVQAICLGFELMHVLLANVSSDKLLVATDAESQVDGLYLTEAARDSVYFRDLQENLLEKLPNRSTPLTFNAHMWGIPPSMYNEHPALADNLHVLSTTKDRQGVEYISTVEGVQYPLLATQWHPEKPPYEFVDNQMPHSRDVMDLTYHTAQAFVDLARLNKHRVSYEEQVKLSIFNIPRTFTAATRDFATFPDTMYFIDPLDE